MQIERLAAALYLGVIAIGQGAPGKLVIAQGIGERLVDDTFLERLVEYGETDFDTAEEVSIHPVGRRQIHILRPIVRSEEHTSELQSRENVVCRLLLAKKKNTV